MKIAYNIFIHLYGFAIKFSSLFYPKAKLWIEGRKDWEQELTYLKKVKYPIVWVHCASLGEFEQARPLLERFNQYENDYFIVLTFFSPSGFEVRKNYPLANKVMYLPLDTPSNAKRFVSLINPSIAIFTKYDIWPNFLNELKQRKIISLLFSANFRKDQPYFRWYGHFFRQNLHCFSKIFVQNEPSKQLLGQFNIRSEIANDTRFDRVKSIANKPKSFAALIKLKNAHKVFVAGSTWPTDEVLLREAWLKLKQLGYKLIIAPHDVNQERLKHISELFDKKTQLFSETLNELDIESDVLIIDTIGDLSSIYLYGHIAYVGGGFNVSVHNVLEPAVYGLPVMFGPNHQKSLEAIALINLGGAFCFVNSFELCTLIANLTTEKMDAIKQVNLNYINNHLGGTELVYNYIKQQLRA